MKSYAKQDIPLFQQEKNLVREYYAALDATPPEALEQVAERFVGADAPWRGFHPFGELTGAAEVAENFWRPLRRALTSLQRRMDIFFAGRNEIDGFESVWVVSMGHLVGLFDQPWLGIAATGKMAFLRYAEFNRVENGRIVDTAMYFDIPHLMAQAGLGLFPVQTAAHLVQPGPLTHDGLLFDDAPEAEGAVTRAAINAMITDLGQWKSGLPLEEELARSWRDAMIWWGPEGIGATYTIARYARQHAGPFRAAFSDRSPTGHICRLAEGHYGGFFGWPNFTAYLTGPFMGMEPTGRMGEFRVIDIYRRDGDKLAENWVFIDLLHFWKMQGVDFLAQLQERAV
jgi:predicted ester cyclase